MPIGSGRSGPYARRAGRSSCSNCERRDPGSLRVGSQDRLRVVESAAPQPGLDREREQGAPSWVRRTGGQHSHRSGPLGIGLTAKYTSSRCVSLRSDWYADPYRLVDAYVSFSGEALSELLRSTEFAIVANNLLDKAYLSAITENAAWLGAPRTVSMTATVSF